MRDARRISSLRSARDLMDRRFSESLDLDRLAGQAGFPSSTEVCMLVGCSRLGSFSSRFSELVGLSPRAIQQASAARGGPPPSRAAS